MNLAHAYNKFVKRADAYLRGRRAAGKWESHLPARIFDAHYWVWDQGSIARGAAWGAALAVAPLPMQSFFALMACLWRRGNIPVGMLACWISFPGYQIFVWPLQWALGAFLMREGLALDSGADWALIERSAQASSESWSAALACFKSVNPLLLALELLLGCLLSSLALGGLFYAAVKMIPRRVFQ